MSGTLFVVATPIGNLEDITLRALRVLREADLIAAEDTRRTAKLLAHYAIQTPTVSFHEHNTKTRLPQLMARLERGERIALVTDAGTPGISDPGVELVRSALEQHMAVEPIPGPTAPLTAAIASGFPLEPLTLLGFPPARGKDRYVWMERARTIPNTFVFFEAPHRVRKTLSEMGNFLGERQIVVGRELTKKHQEFVRGSVADFIGLSTNPRGEYTVVVGPDESPQSPRPMTDDADIVAEFGRMANNGPSGRRALITELAKKHGRPGKDIYLIIEKAKSSIK